MLQTTFLGKVYCVSNFGKLHWLCSCTRITACQYKTNSAESSEVGLACSGSDLVERRTLFFLGWCFLMTMCFPFPVLNGELTGGAFRNGRRTCLPAPSPDTSNINLWNILRNNIGKDLSKVSMPVELNEPLNTLQHLCEELEYSELLDKAAETDDPYERMVIT